MGMRKLAIERNESLNLKKSNDTVRNAIKMSTVMHKFGFSPVAIWRCFLRFYAENKCNKSKCHIIAKALS